MDPFFIFLVLQTTFFLSLVRVRSYFTQSQSFWEMVRPHLTSNNHFVCFAPVLGVCNFSIMGHGYPNKSDNSLSAFFRDEIL